MMSVYLPEEISALFADAHDNFPVIIDEHSEDDVHRICWRNFQDLKYINLRDSTNTTGLILSEVDHKTENKNQMFDRADGEIEAYDPSIQDGNNNTVRLRQEKNWSRKLNI